eukprot:14383-Amphidinium_carterae.1
MTDDCAFRQCKLMHCKPKWLVQVTSIVLYRTFKLPRKDYLELLADLDFPLSIAELAVLTDPANGSGQQVYTIDISYLTLNVTVGEDDDEVTATETLTIFKTKQDVTLRTIALQVDHGSTVQQIRDRLKRFFRLNPAKVCLAAWKNGKPSEDLLDHYIVSQQGGPYFVRIRATNDPKAKPFFTKFCGLHTAPAPGCHHQAAAQLGIARNAQSDQSPLGEQSLSRPCSHHLRVLSWNVEAIRSRKSDLEKLVASHHPDIVLIQETHLSPSSMFRLKGYSVAFRLDRTGKGGGIMYLIRHGLFCKVPSGPTELIF